MLTTARDRYGLIGIVMVLAVFSICFSGCIDNRGAIEKDILKRDPGFQQRLEARDFLQNGIDSRYKIYSDKSKEVDAQINLLHERKAQLRAIYLEFIAKLKRQFDAERKLLQQQLDDYRKQLERKKEAIRNTDRSLREVSSLIRRKEKLELTREEVQVWQSKLSELSESKNILEKEASELKKEIQTTVLKMKVYTLRYRE